MKSQAAKTPTGPRRKPATAAPAASARPKLRSAKISDTDNWDARLGFLMHDVSRLRRSVFDDFMKPAGLTRSQWWILAHLSRHDGMIQSDLANMLDIGKAALGGLLDRLEASQLIERRADETDRRVKRIYLTGKGSQAIQEMRVNSHEVSERILQGLDQAARQALADSLAVVKANLLALRGESGGR
jgi:MarR family transcriptional regulator, transcriptional regulator for hemolysin